MFYLKTNKVCYICLHVMSVSRELVRNLRCTSRVFEQQRVFLLGDILDTREETSAAIM